MPLGEICENSNLTITDNHVPDSILCSRYDISAHCVENPGTYRDHPPYRNDHTYQH